MALIINKWLNMATLITLLLKSIHGCLEIPEIGIAIETEIVTEPPENYYYHRRRNYYHHTTTQRARQVERQLSSSIICSNLSSTDQILYRYTERPYEQFLTIDNSSIPKLKPAAFLQFGTITKLKLSHLHIKMALPGAFNGLSRLRELHLDHNELEELSKGVYNSLHRLEILNLADNRIHQIENLAITGADNLLELHLKNNNISVIEDGLFESQKRLKHLDLSGNPIKEFSLDGLTNLDTLKMAGSALNQFDIDLSNLTMIEIDFSSSRLTVVDFSIFPRVNTVDLSKNQISGIEYCENLDSIKLKLDYNLITKINGSFRNISEISLSHNRLEILHDMLFKYSKNVLIIDLGYNNISSFEQTVFKDLKSLTTLHLQHNNIRQVNTQLFQDLSQLSFLNLSHNQIKVFQFGTFDNLINLKTLDISSNKLMDLHLDTFHFVTALENLHVDNNQISTIDAASLKNNFYNLQEISLENNPWKCQDLVALSRYLSNFSRDKRTTIVKGETYNVENFHGIACRNVKTVTSDDKFVQNFSKSVQEAVDQGMKNSKMDLFFNENFKNSKFFQYFEKNYAQSSFFKYLNNYKFAVVKQEKFNDSKMEKLTSLQAIPFENSNSILVFSAVMQVLIVLLVGCGILIVFSFLKKVNSLKREPTLSSQMELC